MLRTNPKRIHPQFGLSDKKSHGSNIFIIPKQILHRGTKLDDDCRCITTTVDPISGIKNPSLEPLKTLRKYRLAPEGPMRELFKECPIFGVDAGLITPGYIHVGQTVYVRYKSAYRKSTPYYSP
ncbi:MOSC domain-containing protein [Trichostrongylus colubriformis]|uniref:MOSC domain-containing protein n=1 Tax=Trichostrongylus colubriformis TaxID=6319 RepID=A0AAN8F8X5_TRICO